MLPLKLTLSASIYGHPYKWVRTLPATVATGSLIATSRASNSSPFMSISPTERVYPMRRSAPVVSSSQHPYANVGLKSGRRPFTSLYTSKSSSSGDKGGEAAGSSESSDVEEDLILESSQDRDGQSYNQKQLQEKQIGNQQNLKLLTLPTALTLGRVAAVPLIIFTFYVNSWWGITATTSIFIAAAITDWLDGYIARKMQLGTAFGAFLDPVADKLMVAATLVLLCTRALSADVFGQVPWLLTVPSIVIIGREITMSAVREWAASRNSEFLEAVAVNNLGKWKTATQMIALTLLLATRDSSLAEHGVLVASGVVLLYISAGLAVWSLVVYMRKIWRILLK